MKIIPYLFLVTIAIGILEVSLYSTWNRLFFTLGVCVFRLNAPLRRNVRLPISVQEMEKRLPVSIYTKLLVKKINDRQYAIREKIFDFPRISYTPLMRGLLVIDPLSRTVTIKGFLNAYPVFFSILFVLTVISSTGLAVAAIAFIAFLAAISYWIYRIQVGRLTEIFQVLADFTAR